MATKVTVALEDDLNGGPADGTVRFVSYQWDFRAEITEIRIAYPADLPGPAG